MSTANLKKDLAPFLVPLWCRVFLRIPAFWRMGSGRHGEKADTCGNAGSLESIGGNRGFVGEKGIGRETLRATLGRYCGTLALLMFYALCGFGAALVPDLRRLSDFSKIIAERFDTLKPSVQSCFPVAGFTLSKINVAK